MKLMNKRIFIYSFNSILLLYFKFTFFFVVVDKFKFFIFVDDSVSLYVLYVLRTILVLNILLFIW